MSDNIYLKRYAYPEDFIEEQPHDNLGIIVTIPCYNEPDIINSLNSLYNCNQANCEVEVIVVINDSEIDNPKVKQQNELSYSSAKKWAEIHNTLSLTFYIIYVTDLPKKQAGVGLARKIAMDEAVRRFESLNKNDGIITCFDGDCTCSENYLTSIEQHFKKYPKTPGCSIYYEHPIDGINHKAIIDYELFLRYYTHAQDFCGLPYAYQTVGSSMAVRSVAYQKQGGMNKRKAGEDFYFLNKIIALGEFTNLNKTCVFPSDRESDRVPFGTGKAINEWNTKLTLTTYNPRTFLEIKQLISILEKLYKTDADKLTDLLSMLPKNLYLYLSHSNFIDDITRIKSESNTLKTFKNNFFQFFNAFWIMKMVHFFRDNYYSNTPILEAANWLLQEKGIKPKQSAKEALILFRKIDKEETEN